jgi:hypothetical protein
LEYVIDPSIGVDCKIAENRSAIPLVMVIFTPNDRDNGSLFRYDREYNGIREDSGKPFRYSADHGHFHPERSR